MSLIINHNLMAQSAARNLSTSYAALSDSTRKLSSGLRITTAADDAAGLAVRELMRADIASLNQGVRNANDAISLIQTADGALGVIDEKLIRMKELAEQAATGTYTSDQRIIIDSEYQAMAKEITRIANATDFNGIYLLNGNLSSSTHDGSGLVSTGKLKVHFGPANDSAEDYYYIQIGCATASALGLGGGPVTEAEYVSQNNLHYVTTTTLAADLALTHGAPSFLYTDFDQAQTENTYNSTNYPGGRYFSFAQDNSGNQWVWWADGGGNYLGSENLSQRGGASSISTQELAQQALVTVRNAIVSKDIIRANLGALQNRLENTISNLEIQAENLQAAESQISDVDVATEMTEFVRRQILTQAAVAMLSQANSLPQMALQLMG
ncbi:flagellin [Desulfolutivibrio sulfoxidireducens]|uniref:flagellin n=1 Tax=Desulfolutivibrio sulfoxidireducens TaxID=2773299 RepID=UPI0023DD72E4|nr:flagellin [Desulfolutivibrio sulfoxidireducens]